MAVNQSPDEEVYNDNAIAIDTPRPVGSGGQIKPDHFAMIPQHYKFGFVKPPSDPSYNENPTSDAAPVDNKVADASRKQNAPKADNPTTASQSPTSKLPQAVTSADPNGQSQVLMNMMKSMLTIGMIMAMASNSRSSQTTRSTINTPTGAILSNSFSGALAFLAKTYGAEKVLTAFDNGFGEFGIEQIYEEYRDIIKSCLSNFIQNIIYHGESNIPTLIIPSFTYGTNVPTPLYTFPLDMYVKSYDDTELTDFPGYILWVGPNGERIWTTRTEDQPPYTSADQEILTVAAQQIAAYLDPYVKIGTVTPAEVNLILSSQNTNIQTNGMNLLIGHNSSTKLMSNLTLVLGLLGTLTNLAQTLHLPQSVLNVGKVGIAATAFARNIAMMKQMKTFSGGAFRGITAIAGLGGLASLVGNLINGGISAPLGGGVSSLFGNSPIGSVISTAASAALTVVAISSAMKYSGSRVGTIGAASNLLRNFGIAK
jgi:hypothetical protein